MIGIVLREDRSPAQIVAAWLPADVAAKAVLDPDPDDFIAAAASFCGASLLLAGASRETACRARDELHAAACDQLALLRAAGAGRAGNA